MNFVVGETVVYPHHGAAQIQDIKKRTVRGEEKIYLKLKVAQGDLTIEVPAENVDLVGVRDVVDAEGLEHVMEVLRAETAYLRQRLADSVDQLARLKSPIAYRLGMILMSVRSFGLRPVVASRCTVGLPFIALNLRRTSMTRS